MRGNLEIQLISEKEWNQKVSQRPLGLNKVKSIILLLDQSKVQNKAENESNFITLSQISEQERVEIIQIRKEVPSLVKSIKNIFEIGQKINLQRKNKSNFRKLPIFIEKLSMQQIL